MCIYVCIECGRVFVYIYMYRMWKYFRGYVYTCIECGYMFVDVNIRMYRMWIYVRGYVYIYVENVDACLWICICIY